MEDQARKGIRCFVMYAVLLFVVSISAVALDSGGQGLYGPRKPGFRSIEPEGYLFLLYAAAGLSSFFNSIFFFLSGNRGALKANLLVLAVCAVFFIAAVIWFLFFFRV